VTIQPVRDTGPVSGPVRVHTEFHRLVAGLQDAMQLVFTIPADDPNGEYPDAYAALSERRRELYEWVRDHTPIPQATYAVYLKF
jgi:hypothetical protein